jgi:hypothetical protein
MYMTLLAGLPCAKMVSFLRNVFIVLPRLVESRNTFTSKAGIFESAFWRQRRGLLGARRAAAGDMIGHILAWIPFAHSILDSRHRAAQPHGRSSPIVDWHRKPDWTLALTCGRATFNCEANFRKHPACHVRLKLSAASWLECPVFAPNSEADSAHVAIEGE